MASKKRTEHYQSSHKYFTPYTEIDVTEDLQAYEFQVGYGGNTRKFGNYGYAHSRLQRGNFSAEVNACLQNADAIIKSTVSGFQYRAKEILRETIENNVYSVPTRGYRRGDNGGLKSTSMMLYHSRVQVRGVGFDLKDLAPPQGTKMERLDEYIEFGLGREFYKDAEFIASVELEERIENALSSF